ncbi:hypothetical protein EYS14_19565 [Alteromonadaceae bacterium M269]|nr:hypothetical protein EYS14_19565 [Alteromonadaceae bacterium M269]
MKHLLISLLLLILSGCATFEHTQSPPISGGGQVNVEVSNKGLSGWSDLPIGTHRIDDSQVIISGHQKGGGAALLFGVVGVAVSHAANSSSGEKKIEGLEDKLKINMNDQVYQSFESQIQNAGNSQLSMSNDSAANSLQIMPAVVLSFDEDQLVRPFIVLKTELLDKQGKKLWKSRYLAQSGKAKPLVGEDGWISESHNDLISSLNDSVDRATQAIIKDLSEPYARDDANFVLVEGYFPYVKKKLQVGGYKLVEDEGSITFVPKLGDVIVFTGTNVLEKSEYQITPSDEAKPVFKIIKK